MNLVSPNAEGIKSTNIKPQFRKTADTLIRTENSCTLIIRFLNFLIHFIKILKFIHAQNAKAIEVIKTRDSRFRKPAANTP